MSTLPNYAIPIAACSCLTTAMWIATGNVHSFANDREEDKASVPLSMPAASATRLFDLGTSRPNELLKAKFRLRNETASEVRITDVRPSCSCAVTALSHTRLPPNSSTELTLEIESSKYEGPHRVRVVVAKLIAGEEAPKISPRGSVLTVAYNVAANASASRNTKEFECTL